MLLLLLGCALLSDQDLAARMDLDADGVLRPEDCDDNDANVLGPTVGYVDVDEDGFGSTASAEWCSSEGSAGFATEPGDCDDASATVFPGAAETCNEVDDDCDSAVDDGVDVPLWYVDDDGDRYGTAVDIVQRCIQPAGYADNADDCDDNDPLVNPELAWYVDADGDGYGDPASIVQGCEQPTGTVPTSAVDCDDTRADVNPLGTEICDTGCTGSGCDEDCDGLVDDADDSVVSGFTTFYLDADGDGYGDAFQRVDSCDWVEGIAPAGDDCDDADASIGEGECKWVDVDAGVEGTCGIRGDASVECWGNSYYSSGIPTTPLAQVSVGYLVACGLSPTGALACWGSTTALQTDAPGSGSFVDVDVGTFFACAVETSGALACWGANTYGQTDAPAGSFVTVSVGAQSACAIATDGSISCWGLCSEYGECDAPEGTFSDLACSDITAVGLSGTATLYWGACSGGYGACDGAGPYAQITGDDQRRHFCGRGTDSSIECWGNDIYGETLAPTGTGYTDVSIGNYHACAVDESGEIECWGRCSAGECTPPAE